ncbi:MAG: thiamine phosphate synthase [Dokdonella sp.]
MKLAGQGLYAITNGPRESLLDAVDSALRGGARVIQYRDKTNDSARRFAEAHAIAELCASYRVRLIINDDLELAMEIESAGVHFGKEDGDVASARARLGETKIMGISCYDSLERARDAVDAGADYLVFGAFFTSPTKPLAPRASLDLLRAAKQFGLPLVAIGGITPDNARLLIDAGADYVAAISSVFALPDSDVAASDSTDAGIDRIAENAARFARLFH